LIKYKLMAVNFLMRFAARWVVCALGLWVASGILGPERFSVGHTLGTVIIAGFFLAVINWALKPLLVILSFPAIILSLGLFMLILNGFLIMIVHWLYSPLYVKSFGVAVIAGIIVGLVNFLVTKVLEDI
jgi:putative membrane protein